jgi:hypothetical protein
VTERKLLIVSPHFPPTNAVDMHRVRMNVRHYARHGYRPTILTVKPEHTGRRVDQNLIWTTPSDLPVVRTGALPLRVTKLFGISDVALRAYCSLARAGDAIIAREKSDLVFFSTTNFLLMRLGVRWLKRFGVPFVLDYQDPWSVAPNTTASFQRNQAKHKLMRRFHALVERRTAPHASGLIAVSESYLDALSTAYPTVAHVPSATIPFGFSTLDFRMAKKFGTPWLPFGAQNISAPVAIYAGRIGPDMAEAARTLFEVMRAGAEFDLSALGALQAGFLGTGYMRSGNPQRIAPHALAAGLQSRVVERPDRVSLLDSLATLLAADLLLLFGSGDLAYQPSKLYQLMAARKPILCIAPSGSRLAAQVRDLKSVVLLECDRPLFAEAVRATADRLSRLLAVDRPDCLFDERDKLCAGNNAATVAARECALFDRAVAYYAASSAKA